MKSINYYILTLTFVSIFATTPYLPKGKNSPDYSSYSLPVLNKNEKLVLAIQKNNIEEKKKNFTFIRSVSTETAIIHLTTCKIYPVVARIKLGENLTIINHDSKNHTLETDKDHKIAIPKNSKITITADFGYGPGLYSWVCDGSNNPLSGMIIIESRN